MPRRRELADVGDRMTGRVLVTVQAAEFPDTRHLSIRTLATKW